MEILGFFRTSLESPKKKKKYSFLKLFLAFFFPSAFPPFFWGLKEP